MIDNPDWFRGEEHEHLVDLMHLLTYILRKEFNLPTLSVDMGYEKGFGYHCRCYGTGTMKGKLLDRVRDLLAAWTPYRFEVQCVE